MVHCVGGRHSNPTAADQDNNRHVHSARVYEAPSEPDYPYHDRAVRVTRCGRICFGRRKISLSIAFAGQTVGVRQIEDQIWQVSFLEYDLGYVDNERGRVEPGPNPFMPDKVLTMCPE